MFLKFVITRTDSFDAFGRDLFSKVYAMVGWDPREGEGYLTAMLRALVLGRVGSYGLKAAVAEAQKRFKQHVEGTKVIPAGTLDENYVWDLAMVS